MDWIERSAACQGTASTPQQRPVCHSAVGPGSWTGQSAQAAGTGAVIGWRGLQGGGAGGAARAAADPARQGLAAVDRQGKLHIVTNEDVTPIEPAYRLGERSLDQPSACVSFQHMRTTLTVSLPEDLNRALSAMVKRKGISRSQVVQEALRRQLALERFRDLRERLVPKGGEAGFHTDEDVFKAIS